MSFISLDSQDATPAKVTQGVETPVEADLLAVHRRLRNVTAWLRRVLFDLHTGERIAFHNETEDAFRRPVSAESSRHVDVSDCGGMMDDNGSGVLVALVTAGDCDGVDERKFRSVARSDTFIS